MRFLFVHQNFPGQFGHVAAALAQAGHEVHAIGETKRLQARPSPHSDIRRYGYGTPEPLAPNTHPYLRKYEADVRRAQAVARLGQDMVKRGLQPDVVVAHPGWGEALFLKDVFASARHVHYCEYFYRWQGGDVGFDPEFVPPANDNLRLRLLNTTQLIGLEYADAGLSPTQWQASRYPSETRPRIQVIHDGIDTDQAQPDLNASVTVGERRLTAQDEVITYVARNLEPYRGFHVLMRTLPEVLAQRPQAQVLIVGGDETGYGARAPGGATWRAHCWEPIRDKVDVSRVHFLGHLPYATYLAALQISSAHLYWTYPFVLSWSMLEAMAAQCLVIGSATAPVQEVLRHGHNGLLCDFFDVAQWAETIVDALARRDQLIPLRRQARQSVVENFDLKRVCLPQHLTLLGAVAAAPSTRVQNE